MNEFQVDQILPKDSSSRRAIGAAFASAALPGSGQYLIGQRQQGAVLFGILVAIAIFLWPLRMGTSYRGYCGFVVAAVILFATSSLLALRKGARQRKRIVWLGLLALPVATIFASIFAIILMLAAGLHSYKLTSSSMQPTLFVGDTIISDLRAYRNREPQRGDLVVFEHNGFILIKRLIGLPGDRISSVQGSITRNRVKLDEPYAVHDGADTSDKMQTFPEVVVPDGEVFLLGDNRDHSLDNRLEEFGHVTLRDLRGRVLYVVSSKHDQTGRPFP